MAPSGESVYFPSLEKCLSDCPQLISWETAFLALLEPEKIEDSRTLSRFLSDQTVIQHLINPFHLHPPPSQQTKSAFETKTAAINVTPATHGRYDINEIKEDALWLSREAGIDEVSALRIVVLEWQSRPAVQLLSGFAEEELASIQDAAGVENLRGSIGGARVASLFATVGTESSKSKEFLSTPKRYFRLIKTYLSERRHALKLSQMLVSAAISAKAGANTPERGMSKGPTRSGVKAWINEIVAEIYEKQAHSGKTNNSDLLLQIIPSIETRITGLENGSGFLEMAGFAEVIEDIWASTMIEEMAHIMQIIFLHIRTSAEITSSRALLLWFRIMSRHGFFENYNPPSENIRLVTIPLQSWIASVSLAILQLPLSIEFLINPDFQSQQPYFTDSDSISELNDLFVRVATEGFVGASPAVLAWAIILHTLGQVGLDRKEAREIQQSDLAIDDYGSPDDSPLRHKLARTNRRVNESKAIFQEPDLFEKLYEVIRNPLDDDAVQFMASQAVDSCNMFGAISNICDNMDGFSDPRSPDQTYNWVRIMFLDLLRIASNFLDYIPESVSALLSVLADPSKPLDPPELPSAMDDPRYNFFTDQVLLSKFFRTAQARFPYEPLPYLKICRSLAAANLVGDDELPFVATFIQTTLTFTQRLPADFVGYQTVREDENANLIALTRPLEMIPSTQSRAMYFPDSQDSAMVFAGSFIIPPETVGTVISDSKPPVVVWNYRHSGLGYLGRWLELFMNRQLQELYEPPEYTATEIIGFFGALLESSLRAGKRRRVGPDSLNEARRVLEIASDDIDRHGDIISVVCGVFEQELQNVANQAAGGRSLDLLLACLQFLRATVQVLPGRIWPFLSRSSFLGTEGRGGMFTAILSSVEIPSGEFELLAASVKLFVSLVDDAISHSVVRKGFDESRTSSATSDVSYSGTPTHVLSKVLHTFGQILVQAYESSSSWRYSNDLQRVEISANLASAFDQILYYAYGIDDTDRLDLKVTGVLSTFAPFLVDFFLTQSPRDITFNQPLRLLFDGITTPRQTFYIKPRVLWVAQVHASLSLSTSLVKIGKVLNYPVSSLENQLFQVCPVLVRLYASDDVYKIPVATLLECVVRDAGTREGDPPSLLGNLGQNTAKDFGDCLSMFDKPLDNLESKIRIWNLLSALVSSRQRWISIVLLTGSTPRNRLKQESSDEHSMRSRPLLATAIRQLSDINALDPSLAIAILEFVAFAQEAWPWAVAEFSDYPQFIPSLLEFLANVTYATNSMMSNCYTARICSLVADIIAVFLFNCRRTGNNFARKHQDEIKRSLVWLTTHGIKVSGYSSSLHVNLEKNLSKIFPGCKLSSFKRVPLRRLDFGRNYVYDIDMASRLLGYNRAWRGPSNRDQGFEDEFRRLNMGLSKFEAQVQLLRSWKFLASELCYFLIQDASFRRDIVRVAVDCLALNLKDDSPEAIFTTLLQIRAEFALEILQRLKTVPDGVPEEEKHRLLAAAVEATRAAGGSYTTALLNRRIDYYRLLLKVLFLSLQINASHEKAEKDSAATTKPKATDPPSDIVGLVQEVLTTVVAEGFRGLTTYVHEDFDKGAPLDFALLDGILRSSLRIKDIDRIFASVMSHFGDSGAARSAAALFSYADRLTVEGDPVYGDLSIRFLSQLSSVPLMAQGLATQGLLSNLSTSGLMGYFRRPNGSGPFDQPTRLFSIWTSGLLPICVNLLHAVGRSMAAEISAFLNQFKPQLHRASVSFATKYMSPSRALRSAESPITLGMASEANHLALIAFIIESYRVAGSSAGVDAHDISELNWDGKQVKDDIEELLGNREGLRARIVATDEKEEDMFRAKPTNTDSRCQNKLEQRILHEMMGAMLCLNGGAE